MPHLLLASASPRRKLLLESVGLPLRITPANIEEVRLPGESPGEYVLRLSRQKATAVAPSVDPILAADTIVVQNGKILEKPQNEADAIAMWLTLSNLWHEVLTGYTILAPNASPCSRVVSTQVHFKPLRREELEAYLTCDEWRDKAGGYAIQGISGFWVDQIRGSYTNVVGLPLTEALDDLLTCMPSWPPFPWTPHPLPPWEESERT